VEGEEAVGPDDGRAYAVEGEEAVGLDDGRTYAVEGEEAVGLDDGRTVVVITLLVTGTSISNLSKVIREVPLKRGSGSFRSIIWCIPSSLNVCEYRRS
jgi:hypothetical protein